MGVPILIMGESGTGKSTAIRTLDPSTTAIFNVQGKPLPFKGAKEFDQFKTKDMGLIRATLAKTDRRSVVVDDFGYCITDLFMRYGCDIEERMRDQYEVYKLIANETYKTVNAVAEMDDAQFVYFVMHTTVENGQTVPSTVGRLLNEKVNLMGMFTVTLLSYAQGEEHGFYTNNMPPAKTPLGMFDTDRIPNDLAAFEAAARDYWGM